MGVVLYLLTLAKVKLYQRLFYIRSLYFFHDFARDGTFARIKPSKQGTLAKVRLYQRLFYIGSLYFFHDFARDGTFARML
jgi:hypothetical protein